MFLVSTSLAIFGLFSKIGIWRLLVCAGTLNVSLFLLSYFHVGEYNHVDRRLKRLNLLKRRGLTADEKIKFLKEVLANIETKRMETNFARSSRNKHD